MAQRETQGGAYAARNQIFMRCTIAPKQRRAEALSWVSPEQWKVHQEHSAIPSTVEQNRPCPCVACERARTVQRWINRLREAGKTELLDPVTLMEKAAPADSALMARLAEGVDRVIGESGIRKIAVAKPAKGSRSIEKVTETWLTSVSSLYDARTHKTLGEYADKWPAIFGDTIDEIDGAALSKFVAVRLGEVTRSTVKKQLWGLRAFVTWCVDVAKVLDAMPPFPKIPKRATGTRTGSQRAKPVELSREQVETLLAEISTGRLEEDDRIPERYAFMAETGLRPETIDALSVPEHWKPGATELTITDEIDKNRWGRTLPLSPGALSALASAAPKAGPIFGPNRGFRRFKKAVEAAGLPKETAPYDLRHAFATHAVEASGNLNGVAFLVGHRQVTTTNRYVHSSQKAAATVLDSIRSRETAAGSGCRESVGGGSGAENPNDLTGGERRGSNPRQPEPQRSPAKTATDSRDVATSEAAPEHPSPAVQPPNAATSIDGELRLLVSELRAVIADLRAENRRLREEAGEKAAAVLTLASKLERD